MILMVTKNLLGNTLAEILTTKPGNNTKNEQTNKTPEGTREYTVYLLLSIVGTEYSGREGEKLNENSA